MTMNTDTAASRREADRIADDILDVCRDAPYWQAHEKALISAVVALLKERYAPEEQTMGRIAQLLGLATVALPMPDGSDHTALDALFEKVELAPDSYAAECYRRFCAAAPDTRKNVATACSFYVRQTIGSDERRC